MAGEGFEPSKAEPGDLQSPPIGRSGNPPGLSFEAASVDYSIWRGVNNPIIVQEINREKFLKGYETHHQP